MKWRSSYLTELQKSLRPGAKAELVTARKMFGNRKSVGLGTIASYRMDPKQRMQRLHYAMACAKWGTLSSGDKAAYATWAEDNAVTVFSSFLHSYLSQLKEDLRLYLPMEKITGTTVKDYSTYGNDGTETDGTLTKDGFIDNAIAFNGTSSFVDCGDDISLDMTNAVSVCVWLKPMPTQANWAGVALRSKVPTEAYGIMNKNHVWSGTVLLGGTSYYAYDDVPTSNYDGNTWVCFVMTYDGGNLRFFKNGTETDVNTAMSGNIDAQDSHLFIGKLVTYMFDGAIDELRIYKKTLTPEEIRALYVQESKWHGDVA